MCDVTCIPSEYIRCNDRVGSVLTCRIFAMQLFYFILDTGQKAVDVQICLPIPSMNPNSSVQKSTEEFNGEFNQQLHMSTAGALSCSKTKLTLKVISLCFIP